MLLTAVSLMGQVQLPAPSKPAPNQNVLESVDVRYARAQLRLAEANLDRVEQRNKKYERTVPSSVVAEYQDDVRVAKTRLQQATTGRSANEFQVWLGRAEAERRSAETAWKNASAANNSVPGTVAPSDVERLRLRAEVAKLQLERGQALVNAGRDSQLQWQSELLDNQVQRLKEEGRDTTPYVSYPDWWW
jgi:hypothetical protein